MKTSRERRKAEASSHLSADESWVGPRVFACRIAECRAGKGFWEIIVKEQAETEWRTDRRDRDGPREDGSQNGNHSLVAEPS